jgi:hypothetical protein
VGRRKYRSSQESIESIRISLNWTIVGGSLTGREMKPTISLASQRSSYNIGRSLAIIGRCRHATLILLCVCCVAFGVWPASNKAKNQTIIIIIDGDWKSSSFGIVEDRGLALRSFVPFVRVQSLIHDVSTFFLRSDFPVTWGCRRQEREPHTQLCPLPWMRCFEPIHKRHSLNFLGY